MDSNKHGGLVEIISSRGKEEDITRRMVEETIRVMEGEGETTSKERRDTTRVLAGAIREVVGKHGEEVGNSMGGEGWDMNMVQVLDLPKNRIFL